MSVGCEAAGGSQSKDVMARRGASISALICAASLAAIGLARAQETSGDQTPQPGGSITASSGANSEPLRRLDPNTLAGGDPNLAGGDYGRETTEQPPLAGGDYGIATRPEASAATVAPTVLGDPLGAAPRGFRPAPSGRIARGAADDPYGAVGIRAGSFTIRPSLETATGYDDNPDRRPEGGKGSKFLRLRGEIEGVSDWSRHELGFRSSAQIRKYTDIQQSGLEPEINGALTGRIDVTRDTQINSELRASIAASRPGDPETPTGIDGDEITRSAGATLGVARRFNRLGLRLDGLVDRYTVDDAKLRNGTKLDNSDRAYNAYETRLRASYEVSPRLEPFAEVAIDTRDYDQKYDNTDPTRRLGSDGYALRTGARFEMTRLITGEASVGYGKQTPKDNGLKPVEGALVDAAVAWTPTGLTTVRLSATSALQETTLQDASGVLSRNVALSVEHNLRRNLSVTGRASLDRADYKGTGRTDDTKTVSLSTEYRLTRELALTGSLEKLWLDSSLPGEDYKATIFEVGLRIRR